MGKFQKKRAGKRAVSLSRPMAATTGTGADEIIPAPKLRARLGISSVTLWRWRHDPDAGFPPAKVINGRLYFPSGAVSEMAS
jgi:hypothetical protein